MGNFGKVGVGHSISDSTALARDSVAPLRRSSAGWMLARIGRLSAGVGSRHPVTVRKASLMARSVRRA